MITYIHQNPRKHGFVEDFRDWKYSSYHALAVVEVTRLKRDEVMEWFGASAGFEEAHQTAVNKGGSGGACAG